MHKNTIKRTHAPNGRIQCNSHLFENSSLLLARSLSLSLDHSVSRTHIYSFHIALSVHITQTPNELHSTTVQRIRSINAKWMRLHIIFCCAENNRPTKLTAVIFAFSLLSFCSWMRKETRQMGALKQCQHNEENVWCRKQRMPPNERTQEKWDNEEKMKKTLVERLHWRRKKYFHRFSFVVNNLKWWCCFFLASFFFGIWVMSKLCSWIHFFCFVGKKITCYHFKFAALLRQVRRHPLVLVNRKGCCLP